MGEKATKKRKPKKFPKKIVVEMKKKKDMKAEWRKCRSDLSRNPLDEGLKMRSEELWLKVQKQTERLEEQMSGFWARSRGKLLAELSEKTVAAVRKFWSFFRDVSKPTANYTGLEDTETGELKIEQEEMVQIVQKFLLELFEGTLEAPNLRVVEEADVDLGEEEGEEGHILSQESEDRLESNIEESEIEMMIKELSNNKAEGVDRIPPEALKNSTPKFVASITKLFNMMKESGVVPDCWKTGRVVLIHKTGPEELLNNFRPLTIIVAFSGLFSRVLNARLTRVVEDEGFLGEMQAGFRRTRSGNDNTFVLNTVLWKAGAKRKKVHLAFIDLKKAYDTESRVRLWRKLESMGIGGTFLGCLKAIYSGDRFVTEVNGEWTIPIFLGRGLRQGCSLSPILFALYVVAWGEELHACREGFTIGNVVISVLFFADDIILISTTPQGLRRMMDICVKHSRLLLMTISQKKSQVISPLKNTWDLYDENGQVFACLDKVAMYKYLGLETFSTMGRTSHYKQSKCVKVVRRYKGAILNFSRRGPDIIDMAVVAWRNIAIPSILYGTETILFSELSVSKIQQLQNQVFKAVLGLPITAHNVAAEVLLGIPTFQEMLYKVQLKFYTRVMGMEDTKFAYQAMMEHVGGNWESPYLGYIAEVRMKLGAARMPGSAEEVEELTRSYFMEVLNKKIQEASSLGAIGVVTSLDRVRHCREGESWTWITRARMSATGLRLRKGEARKDMCLVDGVPLTEEHVVVGCSLVRRLRMSTGVTRFIEDARMKGLSDTEAYVNFINGLDSQGRKIDIHDYEERGNALCSIFEARIEMSD